MSHAMNSVASHRKSAAPTRLQGDPSEEETLQVLNDRLQAWRSGRNEVVHGMVKSKARPGEDHIDNFLQEAEAYALSDERLVRDLDAWVRRQGKPKSPL